MQNRGKMRAIQALRQIINEMLDEDFESNRKPKLMAMKVKKVEALPVDGVEVEKMSSDDVSSELKAALGEEMTPEMEMSSDMATEVEVKSPKVELEVESEDSEEEMEDGEEEDSDAVKKLRELLDK